MQRPNILFIMTDQQRFDTIAALGHPHVHTPNLDRLARRGVRFETAMINSDPPATSAPAVLDAISEAVDTLQLPSMRMVSRAYHDTLFIAQVVPAAMIFIPCAGGFSHRPDEFASDADMSNGVAVLALTLARLSLL